MDRRSFLGGLLASLPLSLFGERPAAARPRQSTEPSGRATDQDRDRRGRAGGRAVAIASANGLEAVRVAREHLLQGDRPVDAAIAGVNGVELDPDDLTVGYGGLPNFDGVVQLDSAVMDGPAGKGGAVAALEGVKTPSKVARLVMDRTDHVLLVGEGARRFATMHGFPQEELLTEKARKIWLHWRENLSDKDDWEDPPLADLDPEVREFVESSRDLFRAGVDRPSGTIHLSAVNPDGDLGCCTTTSGLFFKIPGRVGDSPLIGAGLYCDNEVGSAGGTGRGEAAILAGASHTVVEFMRRGESPEQACLSALERVANQTRDRRLLRPDGRPAFNLRLYAVSKAGAYGSAAIWGGGQFAVADERGARLEDQAALYRL